MLHRLTINERKFNGRLTKGGRLVANEQNLVPFTSEQNREEAAKNGRKGGIASGEARRQRKTFKEVFNILLAGELSPELAGALNEKSSALGIDTSNFTVEDYIGLAQVVKAVSGDTTAFTTIRDTIGEKPADKQVLTMEDLPDITLVKSKCKKQ